jgi:hypothetical protein
VLVTGATRSGKTTWTAAQVASSRRLLVWDGTGDGDQAYNARLVRDPLELRELVRGAPRLDRVAYSRPVTLEEFDYFCRVAWIWIRQARGDLVLEELADVTRPGKAPVAWGEIVRKGLRYGPRVFALTQRPTECDSTVRGNPTRVHSHRVPYPRDRALVADLLGVDVAEVAKLRPFEWLERDAWGRVTRGRGARARAA